MAENSPKNDLPKAYEPGAIEARWAEYWAKENLFSVPTPAPGDPRPVFSLLLPPPNVTGRLHMGHMLNQTQMDIITRWHRMKGEIALWLPGTDHAGIATQMMVERQLASEGKKRSELSREKFVERVWQWKNQYGGAIKEQMRRLGASVDWGREYFTMDEHLSRAVREVFVRLYEQGLIYRGKYIVNWCPRCETAISDLEVKHEEVPGKLWEIRYPVIGTNEFITVATTRPETMLGDTAVAVNERDERYTHLHSKKVLLPLMNREIPIITDELAQPEFGTGAVKVTPAHDASDFEAGKRNNLPQIEVMDQNARMNQNAGSYAGLDRFEARKRVLEDLRAQGFLAAEKDYTVALGKCQRCGTVVEPRLSEQWFVKIQPLAARAIEVVEKDYIRLTPANYRQVYLNWMRNIHDWTISRQLWWGHRIPAWYCECGEIIVARETPSNCAKCGRAELRQDSDVLDTWFSSGLLPFTSLGWPEATRDLEVFYPTSLLITGFDILFFWVARMIMLGCWFMAEHKQDAKIKFASGSELSSNDSVPFREVYIHALVRDADRQKMSKTKGNVLDPIEVIEKYGTDATRFTLAAMSSPGTDIAFNESRTEGYRAFANKIWNAARFVFMNVEKAAPGLRPNQAKFEAQTDSDFWIASRFDGAVLAVNSALGNCRFDHAALTIYSFFWDDFCDWYLELIKPRLAPDRVEDMRIAVTNLVVIFEASLRLLHPIMPFITEEIWYAMYDGKPPLKSIAFAEFPQVFGTKTPPSTQRKMLTLQSLITRIRDERVRSKIGPKEKIPVELYAGERGRELVEQNLGDIKRLAGVSEVIFVSKPHITFERVSVASSDGDIQSSVSASDVFEEGFSNTFKLIFDGKKIDAAAECQRLKKELEKIEKGISSGQRQLGNEQFLAKAPANVVENMRKQQQELAVLEQKTRSKLTELGCR